MKILVIKELLGRKPNRPQYTPRPPFPGYLVPPPPMPRNDYENGTDYYNNVY